MRTRLGLAIATTSLLAAAGTAQAVHWPYFGGDAGRSGLQPVDQGATPVGGGYELTATPFTGVATPIVTSAGGGPAVQRLAFGTTAGLVHLRVLATGAAVGPEGGRDIVESSSSSVPFGSSQSTGTGFADTSTATALGQLFVVHNDSSGVEIAQIDEATGDLIVQKRVAGTADRRIESSAVATGPDAAGSRSLFFVLDNGALVKVPIARAGARDAGIGEPMIVSATATPDASPTFANLDGVPHVVVGTGDGRVRSFKVADLMPGPATAQPLRTAPTGGGTVMAQTPSVPVAPDGTPPATAPSITVPVEVDPTNPIASPSTTQVFRLKLENGVLVQDGTAQSDVLNGAAASALAVGTRIVVTTQTNLYSLDPVSLKDTKMLSSGQLPSGQGFARNVATISGAFAYVQRDNGEQLVLRLGDAQPVAAGDFTSRGTPSSSVSNVGQPSVSRGFIQYGTSSGLFVYRNRDLVAPASALGEITGGPLTATASDARGIASVTFRVDGRPVGTDTAPDGGSPFNAMMPATFSVPRPALGPGTYTVDAVASDGTLTTVTAGRQLVVPAGGSGPGQPAQPGQPGGSTPPGATTRRKARGISARLSPSRDRRSPYRFTVTGRLTPPTGVACGGRVSVQTKAGRKTISTRRATVRSSSCTYRVRLAFRNRARFGGRSKLTVRVRYLGSGRILPQRVRTLSARVR